MPLPFNKQLDLKLIDLVKENPILYNTKHIKYLDFDTREVVWQKIGDSLNRPAATFAGIQCQIHFGDFQEEKHKPGFIENLREYLPENYSSSWGVEKKIFKEYRKHQGLGQLEAKYLYTKTARDLPTYGVTFFLVKEKEKKGKKKLVPRLLGINAESILRLDEVTKEILQVWPLTHVKTYHVGKGETFTLNFGDYSDKEYCVKTRDAFAIRDILQGYIDLIRKRMLRTYHEPGDEGMIITQETVHADRGNVIEHVAHGPGKIVEHSFVGPTKLIPYEQGAEPMQGTQIITVQQIVVADQANNQQRAMKGEVPMRSDMSMNFVKKLNRLNSNSVKIVTLLTDPDEAQAKEAQSIVNTIEQDMPIIAKGVHETVEKQNSEAEKKKLQDQLQELMDAVKNLSHNTRSGHVNPAEAQDAAKKVADLSTQMYFSLDPKTRRRSQLLNMSRRSFIVEEQTDARLRRPSFIATATTALHQVQNALQTLADRQEYSGPPVDAATLAQLEKDEVDKVGKLSAAVALYLTAHADPKNIDYAAAVNSMNTINETIPELVKDAQAIASTMGDKDRQEFLDDIQALCEATKKVCTLTGTEDHEKMQEASNEYADFSGKLIFSLGRGANADKENEIIELAKQVGDKTSVLLVKANEVTAAAPRDLETEAVEVDAAGVRTAIAARDLLACAQLTAPAIHEPHCQSALTAAAETLSSAAQHLTVSWKPLVEDPSRQALGEQLQVHTMDLAKALDRLKNSYGNLSGDDQASPKEKKRVRFAMSLCDANDSLKATEEELEKPYTASVTGAQAEDVEKRLSDRMAQLNAAIAALLAATADRENPDYKTAELAVNTIKELMPDVVKDSKAVSVSKDEAGRAAILQQVRALCEASRGICASVGQPQAAELGEAVAKFADASGKLVYVVNPRAKPAKEQEIMALSAGACGEASKLLAGVQKLASSVGGAGGAELDARGAHTADAAQALLTAAQVTAPSIESPRCQSALVSAADNLSYSAQQLRAAWQPLQLPAALQPHRGQLEQDLQRLDAQLDKLRAACHSDNGDERVGSKEQERLKFVNGMSKIKDNLQSAEQELNKPVVSAPVKGVSAKDLENKLSDRMAQLNAAIAALLAATSDKDNPDYAKAEQAVNTISELMPGVVKDTKAVSVSKDEATRAAMLQQVRALCEASRGICASVGQPQATELSDAVAKFADASGKLVYVVNPRAKPAKEQEIMGLSATVCGKASQVLAGVQQLAGSVGGAGGAELDKRGAHTADAAQTLLATAQVTAPSIESPRCQSALVSAADNLSHSAQQLQAACQPLQLPAALQPHRARLEGDLQALEADIDQLRAACSSDGGKGEKDRLKLVNTLSKAQDNLQAAEKELNKPITPVRGKATNPEELERKLSDKMAQLNAAIAALIAATSDKENPDFAQAEQAIKTISELMPDVVKETKAVSVSKDEASRAAILQQVRALCEASRGICASVGQPQAAELSDAVAKFADASGKLVYVVNPRAKHAKVQEIMGLSATVCGKASQVLAGVQQLAGSVGGAGGAELDKRGAHTADAAQTLLATAQVTAPSIESPRCQSALVSAADNLSHSAQQLRAACQPLQLPAALQPHRARLEGDLQDLEADIDQLKAACSSDGGKGEKDRLKLVNTLSKAQDNLQAAEKELNKPITPVRGQATNPEELERKLSDKMGQLNAAIAALIAATSDKENPDFAQAEQAVKTISELMPDVVKETKAVSVSKDEASRAAMLQQVRALCEASRGICASVGQPQAAELGDTVAKFADASGKLVYVVNPRAKHAKEQEIMGLSATVCGKASQVLAGVQQLAGSVGGAGGAELDKRGAHTADAAQALLATAQVTAPSIESPRCQSALVSAADNLSHSAQQLRAACQPLQLPAALQPHRARLEGDLQALEADIDQLRAACSSDGGKGEKDRLKLVNTLSNAQDNLQAAEKELNKPITPVRGQATNPEELERKLSDKMAQLNAAIAALIAAISDKENPDFAQAEQAVKTISELMPDVVKETKAVSVSKDEATRAAMLQQVRALCEASRGICASLGQPQATELSDAVAKFADASGKLVYVVNPRAKPAKEQEIMGLSATVCGKASQVLAGVQQLAGSVGGAGGAELDKRGAHTADAAQALLATAQVTAPSIESPSCQSALVSAADNLSHSVQHLRAACQPLQLPTALQPHRARLEGDLQALEADIDQLRAACSSGNDGRNKEKERLKFASTLSKAKDNLQAAEQELNKPFTTAPVKGTKVEDLQNKLADKMAQLNAAVASLISAISNRENPDYLQAEKVVKTITDTMPDVVKDTKAVSVSKDEASRAAMLQQVRALCEASKGICASVGQPHTAELSETVAKFTDASGKLNDVVSPRTNGDKEQRIINASASVCGKASQLLTGVQHLVGGVGDQAGQELDACGTNTADAAQALLTVAQVTAPHIESPHCQSALVSAADKLSHSAQQLRAACQTLQLPAALQPHRRQLEQDFLALDKEIDKLRTECLPHDKKHPSTSTKPRPAVPAKKGPAPTEATSPRAIAHAPARPSSTFAQEFLDQMRMDEARNQGAAEKSCTRETDDEKLLHQQFLQSVDDADKNIRHAEEVLRQVYNSQSSMTKGEAISPGEVTVKQRELEDKLAAAGVEVANLVSANYADNIDYKTAAKSTKVLPQLMNSIAEDAKILQYNLINAEARKVFMNDMLGLCQASRKLCDSAKNNREKLNDAAVEFGAKSAKLLHEVSTDVDPFVEKEIISRAKVIGDSASRLALESAELASSEAAGAGGDGCAQNICTAGASCVDAAGKLVYTAKLVSPSIHNSTCQEALISSAENLSTKLKAFTDSWKPLASDPHNKRVKELATGASELEALLEQLRKDVKGDLGKHRIEKLVVEDTPLRQFTMNILEDAKRRAERTDMPAEQRREYAHYSNRLAEAVRALDLANSRCIRAPHDTNKRRELESAIQNLQAIVLQERPRRGDKDPGKIVDLLDFVKDVSNEAEKMTKVASSVDLPRGKQTVADIKYHCHKINLNAFHLLEPAQSPAKADNTMLDDILEVDQFGLECDNRVEQISSLINNLEGEKAGPLLKEQAVPLTETCNLLRFAAKSAVSTTQSASLEETLNDLDDLENSVIKVLIPECGERNSDPMKSPLLPPSASMPAPWAVGRVAGAVGAAARGHPALLAPALTTYIADAAARTDLSEPAHRDQLLHHLHKLVDMIKSLTVCTSKRVATWQPADGPEVAAITEQILRELENPESIFGGGGTKRPPVKRLLSADDVTRVLSPSDTFKFDGDHKQLSDKLHQLSTQLSSMCSTVVVSSEKPESLSRSLHAAADVSVQLAAVARAHTLHTHNEPIQAKRIEEAAQEMSYSTYNLLKTAEFVSNDPRNPDSRRKLLDACRGLTDSINKLVRVTSPGDKVQRECGELTRSVQLQQGLLQGKPQPQCALPYADCVLALQSQHDVIQKLKSDEAMPREQFLQSLNYVTSAVCNSTEYAAQCAYLIAISDSDKDTAKEGLVDVPQIQKAIGSVQDSCMKIIRSGHPEQSKDEKPKLQKRVQDLVRSLEEAHAKVRDGDVKLKLAKSKDSVNKSANVLYRALDQNSTKEKVCPLAMDMLDVVNRARSATDHPALLPSLPQADLPPETKDKCDQVINNSKTLLTKTQALIKEVSKTTPEDDDEMMTWVMYNTNRNSVLDVFDSLLKSIKTNGHRAGILEIDPSEFEEGEKKSFVDTQVDIANKWLKRASCKPDIKAAGQEATKQVIEIANKMCEDLKGSEQEEMRLLISETEQLLSECSNKYDNEKHSLLMDHLRELSKMVERGVVTRVVEDFMEGEEPLADLDILADAERDSAKRKFLLERKIAELLAQLGRVTTTARLVARTGRAGDALAQDLDKCSGQTELLAPMLVKAAQQRIDSPNDKTVVDNYKALLAKYAESLSKVRELCDQAVDPMDFVQTAGETMQRMREESTQHNDPQKCAYTSTAITKLANRVIQVSLSSSSARSDPELQRALSEAQKKLSAATPGPNVRASRVPDWRDTTAEILRTTGEVESVLGGENIFNKQADADQPIYNAALSLHSAVRGWSSRDNDIVGAARKCAVHMARLADYMHTDRKHELLVASKSIVGESQEVARLAHRLATECTDLRIKTNLLQSCERIPTISGQLKMLTTVKGSSLGHQGSEEDREAMNMLVGNAENLMLSIQEVVKAAASASVKIASQRGPRMRWVRKNYY